MARNIHIYRDEQMKLIMECRTSGLSDYQWCSMHGILPGTFYNWISKLRKKGATIPASDSKTTGVAIAQEVVKVELVPDNHSISAMAKHNTGILVTPDDIPQPAIEILMGNTTIRFFNHTNPELLKTTLQCLGGVMHAG